MASCRWSLQETQDLTHLITDNGDFWRKPQQGWDSALCQQLTAMFPIRTLAAIRCRCNNLQKDRNKQLNARITQLSIGEEEKAESCILFRCPNCQMVNLKDELSCVTCGDPQPSPLRLELLVSHEGSEACVVLDTRKRLRKASDQHTYEIMQQYRLWWQIELLRKKVHLLRDINKREESDKVNVSRQTRIVKDLREIDRTYFDNILMNCNSFKNFVHAYASELFHPKYHGDNSILGERDEVICFDLDVRPSILSREADRLKWNCTNMNNNNEIKMRENENNTDNIINNINMNEKKEKELIESLKTHNDNKQNSNNNNNNNNENHGFNVQKNPNASHH